MNNSPYLDNDRALVRLETTLTKAFATVDAVTHDSAKVDRIHREIARIEQQVERTAASGLTGVCTKLSICSFLATRDPDAGPSWIGIMRSALVDLQGLDPALPPP